ncbi:MAG: hypothetical protein RMJ56_15695 [Gemmataceae bacterium]|nr:hypothetical protein [Gemmata sp.]MDW8199040.1 hypothetical protein [Gemmataceae bacterium]
MATPPRIRYLVIGLAAVVVGGVVIGWLVTRNPIPELAPAAAQQKAQEFLDALRSGRIDEAWAGTSTDFKSMYGRERFRQFVKSKPVLASPVEFVSCEQKMDNPLPLLECHFRPARGSGRIVVVLQFDQTEWKIGRLSVE